MPYHLVDENRGLAVGRFALHRVGKTCIHDDVKGRPKRQLGQRLEAVQIVGVAPRVKVEIPRVVGEARQTEALDLQQTRFGALGVS